MSVYLDRCRTFFLIATWSVAYIFLFTKTFFEESVEHSFFELHGGRMQQSRSVWIFSICNLAKEYIIICKDFYIRTPKKEVFSQQSCDKRSSWWLKSIVHLFVIDVEKVHSIKAKFWPVKLSEVEDFTLSSSLNLDWTRDLLKLNATVSFLRVIFTVYKVSSIKLTNDKKCLRRNPKKGSSLCSWIVLKCNNKQVIEQNF